jgi:hypothetical protein
MQWFNHRMNANTSILNTENKIVLLLIGVHLTSQFDVGIQQSIDATLAADCKTILTSLKLDSISRIDSARDMKIKNKIQQNESRACDKRLATILTPR